jgi:hypothetical protein
MIVHKNELGGRLTRRLEKGVSGLGEEVTGGLKDVRETLSSCVQKRPLESALTCFAGGLLLGRFKIRPIEAVALAALIGLGGGLLLSRPRAGGNRGGK